MGQEQANDGGFAFPQPIDVGRDGGVEFPHAWGLGGMSLRDWFAGMALGGMGVPMDGGWEEVIGEGCAFRIATSAYIIADQMLAARAAPRAEGAQG